MKTKQQAVRFLDDYRNQRRTERIARQCAARRAEAKLLAGHALVGVTAFMALVAASGVLVH